MSEFNDLIQRRRFLRMMAVTGCVPWVAGLASAAPETPAVPAAPNAPVSDKVPRRKLGKTGVDLSCIGLGATMGFNAPLAPGGEKAIFSRALDAGITYWDTAASYNTEQYIGAYFRDNPGVRDKVFLCTKPADITTPLPIIADVQKSLEQSLKTLGTDHVDMFMGVHAMSKPECLTDGLRQFAENAKKKGMIRFFGFSNHANMADNLAAAAKLDWLDAILVHYNYRHAANAQLQAALDACVKAGIGLIAIKSQGMTTAEMTEAEQKLTAQFVDKGFDQMQAKLKFVLEDHRFTATSVGMKKIETVVSVARAATDNLKLSLNDRQLLDRHAAATGSDYCMGCAHICGAATPGLPMMSDIMRFLMYSKNYGEHGHARALFAALPAGSRSRLLAADYRQAEQLCPQGMPIAQKVGEACRRFA